MDERLGPDTQAFPAPQPRPAGWVLGGRYRVLGRIGTGGMAEVFRARDELLNRDVAVKVFRSPVDEPGNVLSTKRRELELRALAQLSHPNLITLFDGAITDSDPAFLVMELIDGPNLAEQILTGPLGEPQVREIGAQIADALAYVHARGMVHRDVKPANILLSQDRSATEPEGLRACLSDFGIVRMIDNARLTSIAVTLGTASYLAPEQARGANVDPAADVYSLGLVLIEALTGVRSFDGPQHEALAARLVRAPEIPAGLPQPWPGLLAAMTAADPGARPTAAQVTRSLRGSAPPLAPLAPLAPLPSRAVPLAAVGGVGAGDPTGAAPAATADSTQVLAPVPADVALADDVPVRHRVRALPVSIAASVVVALVAVAGYLIFRPSSHQTSPGSDVTNGSTPATSAVASTTGTSGSAPGAGVGGTGDAASSTTSTRAPTSTAATSTQATPSSSPRPSSTSASPSTTPSTTTSASSPTATPSSTGAQSASASGSTVAEGSGVAGSGVAGSGVAVAAPTAPPGAAP